MTHTPGPWRADNEDDGSGIPGWNIYGADNWPVCALMDVHAHAKIVNVPNARLIAAAPDLLAELKDTTEHLEAIERWFDANMPTESDGGNALAAAINIRVQENRAAIAKAEGHK